MTETYRKLTRLLLVLAAAALGAAQAFADTPQQIMAACAKAFNQAPSLAVNFSVEAQGQAYNATMTLSHRKFFLDMPAVAVWYDGTTQWTYIKDNRELNITDPTADELMECNPFAILNHYERAYNVRRVESPLTVVELTPRSGNATVRRATVTIDAKTHMPSRINVTLADGRTFTVTVNSIQRGGTPAASAFVYDKERYPASEIVDLR